jgi:outer membrane receptor for monomeric catechols
MPARVLRTIAVSALCFLDGVIAVASERPRSTPAAIQGSPTSFRSTETLKTHLRAPSRKQNGPRTLAADRDPYADPSASYYANRLSSPRAEPILNFPGQTTVLTRQVLDDMNATSLRDAMRSTAGVTVGR